jgi:hypothetical protein
LRTRKAAVATAASFEADGSTRLAFRNRRERTLILRGHLTVASARFHCCPRWPSASIASAAALPISIPASPGPGYWEPLPGSIPLLDPARWVAFAQPFLIGSSSQFRTEGPYALTSDAYTDDFNEVKLLGGLASTVRTPEQRTSHASGRATRSSRGTALRTGSPMTRSGNSTSPTARSCSRY